MELLQEFWFFITHLNVTLPAFIAEHGNMVYALLFAIIFVETGFVVMPFLPGDSLLFVAGSLAAGANASLDLATLFILLVLVWLRRLGRSIQREKEAETPSGGEY